MAQFNYYLKNPKATGETAIILSISSNNDRDKFYTGFKINPKHWCIKPDSKCYQRAVKSKEFIEAPELNDSLDYLLALAKSISKDLVTKLGRQPASWEIKEAVQTKFRPEMKKPKQEKDIFTFWKEHAEDIVHEHNSKTHKPISNHMRISLKQSLRVFTQFSQQYKKPVGWDCIDLELYNAFNKYMQKDLVYAGNTVGKHISNLKYILGAAHERGIETNPAFKSKRFAVHKESVENIHLNESELEKFENLDLSGNPGLSRSRDLFLIGCWTGLRFSDFVNLQRAVIAKDTITVITQKTRQKVVIPILPALERILAKYTTPGGLELPPAISNQKFNEALKEIARRIPELHDTYHTEKTKGGMLVSQKLERWQMVTTHTARRSFATNMYLKDIKPFNIMKITGHKSERQFFNYIKITPDDAANKIREVFLNSNSKSQSA